MMLQYEKKGKHIFGWNMVRELGLGRVEPLEDLPYKSLYAFSTF